MLRLRPLAVALTVVVLEGCTRATFGFRPTLTSQVPDSTVVRARAINGQPAITGRSLNWQAGQPRIITVGGDTVAVPETRTLEVRLRTKKSYAAVGGIVGVAIGMGIALSKCSYPRVCGPDIRPAIGGGVGVLVGSRIRMADWVVVKRPPR